MSITDAARLDLRGAFDFAIMVEEDAQVRYEQLAALLITRSGFSNVQVMFGGAVARVLNQSSNAVTVAAPEGAAGPCTVVVTNRDGAYAVAGGAYTYR